MSTPFILALEPQLDVEWQRFANNWLFRWHNLNMEGRVVDVEDFRGGRFHVGGIVFQGQIQNMYWQAIRRYLDQKIREVFKRWDEETASYPYEMKLESLERTEHLLRFFATRVITQATNTDRALRGNGNPNSVPEYNSSGLRSGAFASILRLVEAHKRLLGPRPESPVVSPVKSWGVRFEEWYARNKGVTWLIGIAIAIIGLAKALLF